MKVAISVPDRVFDAAERLAGELRMSRSQLYAQALAAFLERRAAASVTQKLNEVHASASAPIDAGLLRAQLASIGHEAW